jgi:phosphoglycerol transferase MdoB-like AlkP superfamily enzyme
MAGVNTRRVVLGTIAGGVVWSLWSTLVNLVILESRYAAAQSAGQFLKQPRYPLFLVYWFVTLFVLAYILTWFYVCVRGTLGPGPVTALRVGFLAGFVTGFPLSLSLATWAPFDRHISLWWMLDLWVGAMLATFVSAWLYKDKQD